MLMGHDDDLLLCDLSHPAAAIAKDTVGAKLIDVYGCGIPETLAAILKLLPLDDLVEVPVVRMEVVGEPSGSVPIFDQVQAVLDASQGHGVRVGGLRVLCRGPQMLRSGPHVRRRTVWLLHDSQGRRHLRLNFRSSKPNSPGHFALSYFTILNRNVKLLHS